MSIRFPVNGDPDRWYEEDDDTIEYDEDEAYETALALEGMEE